MSYIISEVDTLNKKSNKDEGVAILHNPAYREQFTARLDEALRKNIDIVQFWEGEIKLIDTKPVVRSYTWNSKRREFEREKQQVVVKNNNSN